MWEEQWKRVHRGYAEISETHASRVHDRDSEGYHDGLYHFFQDCYHLKDWLKHDPATASIASDVETVISASTPLSIAGDIAIRAKHLKLKSTRTGDLNTKVGRRDFKLGLGTGQDTTIAIDYEIESGGKTYDAFSVATGCLEAWTSYLKGKKLL
jgi:hypothetical protein